MKAATVRLTGDRQRAHARQLIDQAPDGYVMKLAAETRRDAQNRLLWQTVDDLRKQVPDLASYSAEDVKNRFLHALGVEMKFLPVLEGQGSFPVGMRSSTLTVEQFSGLIDLLHMYAAKHGVTLRDQRDDARS